VSGTKVTTPHNERLHFLEQKVSGKLNHNKQPSVAD